MDNPISPLLTFAFSVAIFTTLIFILRRSKSSARKTPPSPWKLPLIGHLHHLGSGLPHHALRTLSRTLGDIIHLQLGEIPTIIISSSRLAKEVMKTQDICFASRPEIASAKIMGYNCQDIVFSPYGEYWRQMRKICSTKLLSSKRVQSFGPIRQDEALQMMRCIKDVAVGPTPAPLIDVSEKVKHYTSCMVGRAAFGSAGKDYQKDFLQLLDETLPLAGAFEISDLFPSLKILHPLLSIRGKMMRILRKMDRVLDSIIDRHTDDLGNPVMSLDEDLVDVLLRVKQSGELQLPITSSSIKAVLVDIFMGGIGTSSSILEWAMAEMIRNPSVMAKAQDEIRAAFGDQNKKIISEAKIQKLRYLDLVIKETLRMHPPAPLLVPRLAREECEIDGYKIPKNTRVLVNAWAIGRDPENWDDAESFKPERFESSGMEFAGNDHFEYLPFGAGRRMCPGISFGLANVYLPLALLLFHFDWELPDGLKPDDLDMTETAGITTSRANALLLHAKLYDSSQL